MKNRVASVERSECSARASYLEVNSAESGRMVGTAGQYSTSSFKLQVNSTHMDV